MAKKKKQIVVLCGNLKCFWYFIDHCWMDYCKGEFKRLYKHRSRAIGLVMGVTEDEEFICVTRYEKFRGMLPDEVLILDNSTDIPISDMLKISARINDRKIKTVSYRG